MENRISDIILEELKRHNAKLDNIVDRQFYQHETLIKNTVSLEEHMKRTDILEKRNSMTEEIIQEIKDELGEIKAFIKNINLILELIKPTKEKIKWVVLAAGLLLGSYTTIEKKEILQQFFKDEKTIEKNIEENKNTP